MPKLFLKALPRCVNPRNLRFLHFWSIKRWAEWCVIYVRGVFWHNKANKRLTFSQIKNHIFEKYRKCCWNRSFFSTVRVLLRRMCAPLKFHLKILNTSYKLRTHNIELLLLLSSSYRSFWNQTTFEFEQDGKSEKKFYTLIMSAPCTKLTIN